MICENDVSFPHPQEKMTLELVGTGICLDVDGVKSGGHIKTARCTGTLTQQWAWEYVISTQPDPA